MLEENETTGQKMRHIFSRDCSFVGIKHIRDEDVGKLMKMKQIVMMNKRASDFLVADTVRPSHC